MSCASRVLRYISGLTMDEVFLTGDLLHLGSRRPVDQATKKLVDSGIIFRVVRGMFIRDITKVPSIAEIACAKAKRFNKQLVQTTNTIVKKFGLCPDENSPEVFAVNGRSSSFMYGDLKIVLKGVSNRKVQLGESSTGQVLRYLWFLGKKNCLPDLVSRAIAKFRAADRRALERFARLIPGWLSDYFSDIADARYGPGAARKGTDPFASGGAPKSPSGAPPAPPFLAAPSNPDCYSDVRGEATPVPKLAQAKSLASQFKVSIPADPKLKSWLKYFSIERRILSPRPGQTTIVIFSEEKSSFSRADRLRAVEDIVAKDPTRAVSRFFAKTTDVALARARLRSLSHHMRT